MKTEFKAIPRVLKSQIIKRAAFGVLFLVLFIILISTTKDFILAFPCAVMFVFLSVNVALLLFHCINCKIICVNGLCTGIEKTKLTKRQKSILLSTDQGEIKLPLRRKLKYLQVGAEINVFLNERTLIYEREEVKEVYSYYAIEIKK